MSTIVAARAAALPPPLRGPQAGDGWAREAMLAAVDAAGAPAALQKLDRYEGEAQAKKRKATWPMPCPRTLGGGEAPSLWR